MKRARPPRTRPAGDPSREADDARLWRAVNLFRVAAWCYAAILLARSHQGFRHPVAAWLVIGGLGAWTVWWLVRRERPTRLIVADLVVAVVAVLATRWVDEPARIAAGAHTLPAIWPASAVLAWSVWREWRGGLVAATAIVVADLVEVGGGLSTSTLNNIVLLLITGGVVGYAVRVFREGRRDLAAAVAVRAAAHERERLARDIHDSVLQVLAYIQRRGAQVGGEAAELAALAGEQEVRLRALVSRPVLAEAADGEGAVTDLAAGLSALAASGVTVSGPAGAVPLPSATAAAVLAAVGAALDNVRRHAGERASAWVLLEDEGERVTVTVRDDGVGIPAGRLAEAEREGRLGVACSIRGRIVEVGGTVEVVTAPGQGTEVELRVPRPAPTGAGR